MEELKDAFYYILFFTYNRNGLSPGNVTDFLEKRVSYITDVLNIEFYEKTLCHTQSSNNSIKFKEFIIT